jgi:predicted N-acetyltransferase YhbS
MLLFSERRISVDLLIRQENVNDYNKVYELVKKAFEKMEYSEGDEQDLVNRLRKSRVFIPELSLVAIRNNEIVGHIMFTKGEIENNEYLVLAPLAVLPEYQKQGIGTALINEGHKIAKELGFTSIVVVGHEKYYPRFGYEKASKHGIIPSFEVPDECFMVIELVKGSLLNVNGTFELVKEFFEK